MVHQFFGRCSRTNRARRRDHAEASQVREDRRHRFDTISFPYQEGSFADAPPSAPPAY